MNVNGREKGIVEEFFREMLARERGRVPAFLVENQYDQMVRVLSQDGVLKLLDITRESNGGESPVTFAEIPRKGGE